MAAGRPFTPLFQANAPIMDKVNGIAKRIYKAEGVQVEAKAKKQLDAIEAWGYGHLPVCMAKTQYSFSHDAGLLGAPVGFTIPVREFSSIHTLATTVISRPSKRPLRRQLSHLTSAFQPCHRTMGVFKPLK